MTSRDRIPRPLRAPVSQLQSFAHHEAAGGILLLAAAAVALLWANSAWHESYEDLWQTSITIGTPRFHLTETLGHWINDGLMAMFFFVVGLEIKREVLVGELASVRSAALPAVAALGGVIVPAGIYYALNAGHAGSAGWGVPMATDIAFALGVLALIGDRVPIGLTVFLTALAIVDDIAAVLVIAVFYTESVATEALLWAGGFLVALVAVNRLHIRHLLIYALLGIGLWVAVLESGVHATVAGVLLALTIPARTRIDPEELIRRGHDALRLFERDDARGGSILTNGTQQDALAELEDVVEGAGAPLQRLEHGLHPWVAFAIIPLFALANAGVRIEGDLGDAMGNRITVGVVLGLVLGKQIGIFLFTWLAVRSGRSELPMGVGWGQIYGAGWLAGIGFTMSLFVAELAFAESDAAELLMSAKLGILAASLIAGLVGWTLVRYWSTKPERSRREGLP